MARSVLCSGGADADCAAERPAASKGCQEVQGCGYTAGPWSACNATCGLGYQSRSATCDAPGGGASASTYI